MKSKKILLTTLAAAITAAIIPANAAFAAADSTLPAPFYPENFIEELDMSGDGLSDYAIWGESSDVSRKTYAFAVKTTIYVIATDESGDRKLTGKDMGTQITALDYAGGQLYYKNTSGNAYAYPNYPDTSNTVEHEFAKATLNLELGDSIYLLNSETELKHFNKTSGVETMIGDGYSSLKVFDGVAYTVKENVPQVLNGTTATPLDLHYTDFTSADNISTGSVAGKLKATGYQVKTATIEDGSYYTQIDTDSIGEVFKQVRTYKADGAISCLVLASDGNLSVVVAGGNCYITATDNLKPVDYSAPANDWPINSDNTRKAYIRERTGIYASPYMCAGTLIERVEAPSAVTVTVIEKFSLDFIDPLAVFYRVKYTNGNNKEISGWVAAGFLDAYDYSADENTPTLSGNEGFSYETNVATVILVLVVVGLVIIAIAYLTIVGTKPDKPVKKSKKKIQEDDEDESESENE